MVKILTGITRLYLDANILIYLLEGDEETQERVHKLFVAVDEQKIDLVTSEITITECLIGAIRDQNPQLIEAYNNLFAESGFLQLAPVSRNILVQSAKTSALLRLKTVDALHYTTAIQSGCDGLITNDKAFKSSPEVKVIPFAEF